MMQMKFDTTYRSRSKDQRRMPCEKCGKPTTLHICKPCRRQMKRAAEAKEQAAKPVRVPWEVTRLGVDHRILPFVLAVGAMSFENDSD